jgi:putative transposase
MAKVVKSEITESVQQLKALLIQQRSIGCKERVQALYLLKSGQLPQVIDVAQALGRNLRTVQRWLRHYRTGGLAKLLAPRQGQGRKPQFHRKHC